MCLEIMGTMGFLYLSLTYLCVVSVKYTIHVLLKNNAKEKNFRHLRERCSETKPGLPRASELRLMKDGEKTDFFFVKS